MVEKILLSKPDFFAKYREDEIVSVFTPFIDKAEIEFKDKELFLKLKPHLIEWFVLRIKFKKREISKDDFNQLVRKFGDEHDSLFANESFVKFINLIREKVEYNSF